MLCFYRALKICAIYTRCLWILAWCWVISEIWHCLDCRIAHRVKSSQYWAYNFWLGSHKLSSNLWLEKGEKKRYQKSNLFSSTTALMFSEKNEKRAVLPSALLRYLLLLFMLDQRTRDQVDFWCCGPAVKCKTKSPGRISDKQSFYLLIFISSGKRGGGGKRENSLLNPSTNTILIHIHVQYLLTCIAYDGGYQLGYSAEGKGQSY